MCYEHSQYKFNSTANKHKKKFNKLNTKKLSRWPALGIQKTVIKLSAPTYKKRKESSRQRNKLRWHLFLDTQEEISTQGEADIRNLSSGKVKDIRRAEYYKQDIQKNEN